MLRDDEAPAPPHIREAVTAFHPHAATHSLVSLAPPPLRPLPNPDLAVPVVRRRSRASIHRRLSLKAREKEREKEKEKEKEREERDRRPSLPLTASTTPAASEASLPFDADRGAPPGLYDGVMSTHLWDPRVAPPTPTLPRPLLPPLTPPAALHTPCLVRVVDHDEDALGTVVAANLALAGDPFPGAGPAPPRPDVASVRRAPTPVAPTLGGGGASNLPRYGRAGTPGPPSVRRLWGSSKR